MSDVKHQKLAIAMKGTESYPQYILSINGNWRFQTVGGDDKANAEELLRRWNNHDALVDACKKATTILAAVENIYPGRFDINALKDCNAILAKIEKEK